MVGSLLNGANNLFVMSGKLKGNRRLKKIEAASGRYSLF
jgi:hypothetical protein